MPYAHAHKGALESHALLPARLALGSAMVYHGTDKLRGKGPAEQGQFFESVGVRPGKPWAIATGLAELGAGVLAIAGIATRPAALAVLVTQAMAVAKVHGRKGYALSKGGFEYNVALMAMAAGILLAGPGRVSWHERLHGRHARRRRGLFQRRPAFPRVLELLQ